MNKMNFGPKTQAKIRKIISSALGLGQYDPIKPESVREKGYSTVMVRYEQALGDSNRINDVRKPEAGSQSVLVPLCQTSAEKDGFFILSKYWVEIPKSAALTMLALNHLPDARQVDHLTARL